MHGTLYLIPNTLGEGTLDTVIPDPVRARTASLQYFIAENAKSARAFLKLVGTTHPLRQSLQETHISELNVNTPAEQLPALLTPLLQGHDVGLLSEAGVPAVADPGADLVRLAHRENITVKPLVGPSSLLLALMASGLNGQSFAFHGYLPTDADARATRLRQLEQRSRQERQTQMFIETPYRNAAMMASCLQALAPQTHLCLALDLSLPTEEIRSMAISDWKKVFSSEAACAALQNRPCVFLLLAH
jgi:16S rRNA (cytidine1402-2'-O)-methyltransferase